VAKPLLKKKPVTMMELRHGRASSQGPRSVMEDLLVTVPDLTERVSNAKGDGEDQMELPEPSAYFGVFDGHAGICAATFARNRLLDNIVSHEHFPETPIEVMREACLKTDTEFEEACTSLPEEESGTTVLAMLVMGDKLMVANIGDSRAVLSRRGQAVAMSQDQKPTMFSEWERIQKAGGYIDEEGFLNGQLAVSRAVGDFHVDDLKRKKDGSPGPLIADPDIHIHLYEADDEFVLMASDGLWDVFSSQGAVTFARGRLQEHNDPDKCSEELIEEALKRHTTDNITCVCVCFSGSKPPQLKPQQNAAAKGDGMGKRTLSSNAVHDLQKALKDVESKNMQKEFNNLGISGGSFTAGGSRDSSLRDASLNASQDRIPETLEK